MSLNTVFGGLGALLLAANAKNLPLMYHLRTLWVYAKLRVALPPRLPHATRAVVRHNRVHIGDLDFNLHANNSIYSSESDFARWGLFAAFLGPEGALQFTSGRLRFAVGAVSNNFRKEMKLGTAYAIVSRVIAADEKWFYVECDYVSSSDPSIDAGAVWAAACDAGDGTPAAVPPGIIIHASQHTRVVFKEASGKTVTPPQMLERLGYPREHLPAPSLALGCVLPPPKAATTAAGSVPVGARTQAAELR